jgi:hypothetical protein
MDINHNFSQNSFYQVGDSLIILNGLHLRPSCKDNYPTRCWIAVNIDGGSTNIYYHIDIRNIGVSESLDWNTLNIERLLGKFTKKDIVNLCLNQDISNKT